MEEQAGEWRLRPVWLAALGVVACVAIHQLVDVNGRPAEWRTSLATAIGTAAVAFGFAAERVRLGWTAAFALAAGATAGLIHQGSGGGNWWWFGDWRYLSLYLAIGVALPLFQTARDAGAWRFPYAEVHEHGWTNAMLWFACWFFAGIAFLLAWLLAALFGLIGLKFLRELLDEGWAAAALLGAAFGGALGIFRERDRVIRLLRRVATAVLAVLAPVLGAGLVLFLLALPFTGLTPLWATRSATATLLACVVGALLLANAAIGDGPEEEASNPALRWGALALAAAMLPLAALAAVAIGLRLDQYGPTPDRLWALVFVVFACAYGLAYVVAVLRRRQGWAADARVANLRLAFGVAGVALLLATPLISFNAIATRAQVARLESGRVNADKFDWAALAFDFGDAGKAALRRLQRSSDPVIAARARDAANKPSRWAVAEQVRRASAADELAARLRVLPGPTPLPPGLRERLTEWPACGDDRKVGCTLLYRPGAAEAIVVRHDCLTPSEPRRGRVQVPPLCAGAYLRQVRGEWRAEPLSYADSELGPEQRRALAEGLRAGRLDVRPVERRQLFVGGVPLGGAFE